MLTILIEYKYRDFTAQELKSHLNWTSATCCLNMKQPLKNIKLKCIHGAICIFFTTDPTCSNLPYLKRQGTFWTDFGNQVPLRSGCQVCIAALH